MIDVGSYHLNKNEYQRLVDQLYADYPCITLPPEYGQFVQDNLLRLLIRLARYKFVARLIKQTDRILEVGCGSGLGSIFLGQNCAHVTGIDVKKTEVEEARKINCRTNVDFKLGNFFELEVTQQYDVIVALDVIEHLPAEEGALLVRKMGDQLKPDGMAVIGTPSVYSSEYQSPLSKASHVKCYDQPELIELLESRFCRTLAFSMNDELVHTGFYKLAWYYFVLALLPKK